MTRHVFLIGEPALDHYIEVMLRTLIVWLIGLSKPKFINNSLNIRQRFLGQLDGIGIGVDAKYLALSDLQEINKSPEVPIGVSQVLHFILFAGS